MLSETDELPIYFTMVHTVQHVLSGSRVGERVIKVRVYDRIVF